MAKESEMSDYKLATMIERISGEIPPESSLYARVCFLLAPILPDNASRTLLNGKKLLSQIYNEALKDVSGGSAMFWFVLKESGYSDHLVSDLKKCIPCPYTIPQAKSESLLFRILFSRIVSGLANDREQATGLINTVGGTIMRPRVTLRNLPAPSEENDYSIPLLKFFENFEQQCLVTPDDLDNLRQWLVDAGQRQLIKKHVDTFDPKQQINIPGGLSRFRADSKEESSRPNNSDSEMVLQPPNTMNTTI